MLHCHYQHHYYSKVLHGTTVQWSWRGSGVVFPWSAMTQGGLGMVWNGLALVGIPGCPDHQGFGTDSRWSKVVREACYSDHLRPSKTTPHPGQPRTTQEWSAVHSRPPSPQTSPNYSTSSNDSSLTSIFPPWSGMICRLVYRLAHDSPQTGL